MSILRVMQANSSRVSDLYSSKLDQVLELQSTLIHDILPSMTGELDLDHNTSLWAKDWLQDTGIPVHLSHFNC